MQPEIKQLPEIYLMGMSFYGDPFDTHNVWEEENRIGQLWQRFMHFLSKYSHNNSTQKPSTAFYEVHISNEETQQKGLFEVFVGMPVNSSEISNLPIALSVKVLPAALYAVFTFEGKAISSDWEKTIQHWLSSSGYAEAGSFTYQYYDERFKGMDKLEESTLDVYVPIKKAA